MAESVVPAVSKSTDGLFEITTITFGFSGTAPYHQQKFTAEFSFSISETANFYEIAVSSDDTATVRLGGNDFVSSQLNRNGVASSAWSDTAATLPEVSGTFETVGGPYSLSVTITLKRLVGAEWTVSEEWTESGPYEIKTATLSFSGNARSDTQGFSWNSPEINIDGGNWVEIEVDADDYAQVNVGEHSAEAALNNPETYGSDWVEEAPASFPITVSYRNAGGPYQLSVTVTVKRSLRLLELGFLYTPPSEGEEGKQDSGYPISSRRIIGVGESICVYSSKRDTFEALGDLTGVQLKYPLGEKFISGSGDNVEIEGVNFIQEGTTIISANFSDGEIITEEINVLFPQKQDGEEITCTEYLVKEDGSAFAQEELTSTIPEIQQAVVTARHERPGEIRSYRVKIIEPKGVSFSGIDIWECTGTYEVSGIFEDTSYFPEAWRSHAPKQSLIPILPLACHWVDDAGLALHKLPDNYENFPVGAVLGTLTWKIPTRWNVYPTPPTDPTYKERTEAINTANDERTCLGEFSFESIQTMTCLRTETGIKVVVTKRFSENDSDA